MSMPDSWASRGSWLITRPARPARPEDGDANRLRARWAVVVAVSGVLPLLYGHENAVYLVEGTLAALRAPGRLARLLDGGQQQGDQEQTGQISPPGHAVPSIIVSTTRSQPVLTSPDFSKSRGKRGYVRVALPPAHTPPSRIRR